MQHGSSGLKCGSGGHYIIDQQHPLPSYALRSHRVQCKSRLQIVQALMARQLGLGTGVMQSHQRMCINICIHMCIDLVRRYQCLRQYQRLVKPALAQALCRKRNGQYHIDLIPCKLVRSQHMAHDVGQRMRPTRIAMKFKGRDHLCPRVAVGDGCMAGLKGRAVAQARPALRDPVGNDIGTGTTTRLHVSKAREAGTAQALRGPAMTDGALTGHAGPVWP